MNQPNKQLTQTEEPRVAALLNSDAIRARFDQMLGDRSPAFMSSIVSAVNSNPQLKQCEPMSVISAAAIAASMALPINASLGLAYIVPYAGRAQFQIGWKGFIQLAMRSGQYKTINTAIIYEGQLKNHNPFTGEMEFQPEATSQRPQGYLLYFKLLNGYEKYFYMTKVECEAHAKKYSKPYASGKGGQWAENFDTMALKTVVKQGLSKYGILSIDMQTALESDAAEAPEPTVIPAEPQPQGEQPKTTRLAQIVAASTEDKTEVPI